MLNISVTGAFKHGHSQAQYDCITAMRVRFSFLRPAGKADIGGELLDVISEGEFIEKDAPIRVVDIRGNRILVAKRSES